MLFKEVLIWGIINGQTHSSLTEEEMKMVDVWPLVSTLFPGINYYSVRSYTKLLNTCVKSALTKLYPGLQTVSAESLGGDEMISVEPFLPAQGFEWEDSDSWKSEFNRLLAA